MILSELPLAAVLSPKLHLAFYGLCIPSKSPHQCPHVQVLPKQFGGEAQLIPVQDSKAALRAKQQQ